MIVKSGNFRKDVSGQNMDVLVTDAVGVGINVSTATGISFAFTSPSGSVVTISGAYFAGGGTNCLRATTSSGSFNQVGTWRVRVIFSISGVFYNGPEESFIVLGA